MELCLQLEVCKRFADGINRKLAIFHLPDFVVDSGFTYWILLMIFGRCVEEIGYVGCQGTPGSGIVRENLPSNNLFENNIKQVYIEGLDMIGI